MTRILILGINLFFLNISFSQIVISKSNIDSISFFFKSDSVIVKFSNSVKKKILKYNTNEYIIEVFAYTDNKGSEKHNKHISDLRLSNTLAYIEKIGFKSKTLKYSLGESKVKYTIDSLNRRVDLYIVKVDTFKLNEKYKLNIGFNSGSLTFMNSSYSELKKVALILKNNLDIDIELHGHVCCIDDEKFSYERAETVKKYLIKFGIDSSRINVFGHSNKDPLVIEKNDNDRQKNRRVEIIFKNSKT